MNHLSSCSTIVSDGDLAVMDVVHDMADPERVELEQMYRQMRAHRMIIRFKERLAKGRRWMNVFSRRS